MVTPLHWKAISASVRGTSHEQSGQHNQDSVRLKNPTRADACLLLAVADGHGSSRSFRSERGSQLATECANRLLNEFVRHHATAPLSRIRQQALLRWPKAMVEAWRNAVRAELESHPFSPLEFAAFPEAPPVVIPGRELPPSAYLAYGATLIAVAITSRYILYSQLGDGDILNVGVDGTVSRPLRRKHEFMANQTVSLCTDGSHREFQVRVVSCRADAPAMITLSSDGYANCFGDDESFFKVGGDLLDYVRANGMAFVGERLEEWLRDSSRDGSGDDITVGLAVRSGALTRIDPAS